MNIPTRDQTNKSRSSTKLFSILKHDASRSSLEDASKTGGQLTGEKSSDVKIVGGVRVGVSRLNETQPATFKMNKSNASFGGEPLYFSVDRTDDDASLGRMRATYNHGSMLSEISNKQ